MALIYGSTFGIRMLNVVEVLRHRETYRQHWHAHRILEMHYVLTGAITYEFTNGHPGVTIPGGSFLAIPAGIRHRAINNEGAPSVRCVTRWRTNQAATETCPFSAWEIRSFFRDILSNPLGAHHMTPRLAQTVRDVFHVVEDRVRAPFLRITVWSLLAETVLAIRSGEMAAPPSDEIVRDLCAHVATHCGAALHLDDLVRLSGYSKRHLLTLFRQKTGLSPGNYLTRCRIDRAKQMLSQRPRPHLIDIALACGFSSASHFTSVFRKYAGVTPSQFSKSGF